MNAAHNLLERWTPPPDRTFLQTILEMEPHRKPFERSGTPFDALCLWVWLFGAPKDLLLKTALRCASYILTGNFDNAPDLPPVARRTVAGHGLVSTTPDIAIPQDDFRRRFAMRDFMAKVKLDHLSWLVHKANAQPECARTLAAPTEELSLPLPRPGQSPYPLGEATNELLKVMDPQYAVWAPRVQCEGGASPEKQ